MDPVEHRPSNASGRSATGILGCPKVEDRLGGAAVCILARDMRLTGAKAAGERTARPATFPLDPRTTPPRIWRLLSDHMARTPYG